ncbi:heavy chain of dynein [Chloropicon primus]|uniref:Heavy chain of dynein n=1 Tax=Chloropicon primus TaxID=1764295 RepID=A0A5B8MNQ9_9CHLO|nr:heavy chain of dynein [Chloropicon primus]UPR01347.1 heavy chain of dynein [Chloropicon primus]|eukprot:QDZ22129.1 heavy chain of dynein [Chloropicon primus]
MDPLKENESRGSGIPRLDRYKPSQPAEEEAGGPGVLGVIKSKSKSGQFFRVPRPPAKGKPSALPERKDTSSRRDPYESHTVKVQIGVTTGVELVMLLGESHQGTDELSHHVYYFVESEPANVILRNPYELVLVTKVDCEGKDFFTITKSGVTEFSRKNGTETTPLLDWLKFRNMFNMINKDPFRFPLMKAFKIYKAFYAWKCAARIWKMESAREKLKVNLFLLNPTFNPALLHVQEVVLSCGLENVVDHADPEASPRKKKGDQRLLSAFGSAIEVFQSKTRLEGGSGHMESLSKRLHQCFIEVNRQIGELQAHIQMIVNTVCHEFSDIQFSSDKEQDWMDKISDVDMTVRDIKFMFPQRSPNRNQNTFLNENIVEIFSKSQNQQKIIISFVRLVEVIIASAIAETMKETTEQIHSMILSENRSIVTLKTQYGAEGVSIMPPVRGLTKFFTKSFRDMADVSVKLKRPLVFPLTKNNEVPPQFQRKNFVALKDLVDGFGINIERAGGQAEAHIVSQFEALVEVNSRLLSIPQSEEFKEAMNEARYISSGRVEELKLNPRTFSKNLIVIRDWLDLIDGTMTESQVNPLLLDLSDLKTNLQEDLTAAYNLFVERLHGCLEYHGRHILDEMVYNSYDIKTLSDDLQLFVDECVRVEQDAYSTEDRVNIIGSFFDSLRKVLKYVDKSDSFNQRLEENFSTAEVLMNEVERLLRNKIQVSNATQIKKSWDKFLDEKANYLRTLRTLSTDIVNHCQVYINQLLLTVDCFCDEIQAIEGKLSSDDSFDTSEDMKDSMQKHVSFQLMKIETEIKKKGETSDNLQDMLKWWINTQAMLQTLNPGGNTADIWQRNEAIRAAKERGKSLFEHVNSVFHWKKKFWLSDILIWMEVYERLTTIRPFSSDLSQETLAEVNSAVNGHIEILNERLDWANKSNFVCKETSLIKEIVQAGEAWINTLNTFNEMISNPNHPSSVQLRHRLTVEMKRKGKSLLECTLADIHGRSASGFSLEKNQVKQEEDNYGKALFDLFHVERQMRGTYFMINSRVSSNGSIHLITNFMEIFQAIEKAEQVIVNTSALAESLKAVDMGENTKELHIEMNRVSDMVQGIRYGTEILYQAQSYYLLFSRLSASVTFFKCAGLGYVNDCIYIKQRWQDEIIGPLTSQKQISILSASHEMDIMLSNAKSPATDVLEALHELYNTIVEADILLVAREAYPRLYFIPDSILLHSLAYEDDPQKLLKKFFMLCYSGVARLDVEESEIVMEGTKNQPLEIQEKHIVAIYGEQGERIPLGEPLLFSHVEGGGILSKTPQTKSESKPDELTVWAVKLEDEIKETMKVSLAECNDKLTELEIDEWIDSFPLQSIWLTNEIMWVKHVESHLPANKGELAKLGEQMSKKVNHLSNRLVQLYPVAHEFQLKIKKIESLIYSGICHRDIAQHLSASRIEDVSDFSWQKFVRYYWNKDKRCCYVACGFSMDNEGTGFEYGFEYLGDNFTSHMFNQGLSMSSNAVLGLAHATFGTSCVTPVSQVVGAGIQNEAIKAMAVICGKHLVVQDASRVVTNDSKDSWEKFFLACRKSKSWMQLIGVDWFDFALVSKMMVALDEVRMKLSSDLVLSKDYSSVRYFVSTDQRYEARYRSHSSPLEKVARKVCVMDWSFQVAFEAAIELKLRSCGQRDDTNIAKELSMVISSIVRMMQKYMRKGVGMNSVLTISKQIVHQVKTHDMDFGNCRFVILNALKKGLGQFLSKSREAQVEELYWQLLAGHRDTFGEEEALANFDLDTETDLDLNQYLHKDQLKKGYAYYSDSLKQKCLQMLDAISEDKKSILVAGSPGSGKSALIKAVFEAFETKLMKNKNAVRRIYTEADLEDINFLVSNHLLIGAREAHRLKLLLVDVKISGGTEDAKGQKERNVDQNIILDGILTNQATMKALKEKDSAELEGYSNIPRLIVECISLENVSPALLTSVHMVHCGHAELLSLGKFWECSLEAFEAHFKGTPIVEVVGVHKMLKGIPLPYMLAKYSKLFTVVNVDATEIIADHFKVVKVFFDLLQHYLTKHMSQVEVMSSNSKDKTRWETIKLCLFSLAWSLESQLLRANHGEKQGFEREIVRPIVDKYMRDVELGIKLDNILDYDVTVTSSGHFQLSPIEDPTAVYNDSEGNLGMVDGVIITNGVYLQRKMLLRWIDDFKYDVLVLGSINSAKRLLMGDIRAKHPGVRTILSNSLHTLSSLGQHAGDVRQQNRVVLIEDLHVSRNALDSVVGQETLRKFLDEKKHGVKVNGSEGKHQFVCSTYPKHCDGLQSRFCSERLFHHFFRFNVQPYKMVDISNIFLGQIHLSVCTEYEITEKELKQGCQTLILSLMTMTFNLFEKAHVDLIDPVCMSPKMLSQMYNYLEISVHDLIALDKAKLSDIKEWGKILVENLHCLQFSGPAYGTIQKTAVEMCNDPIMNFLRDSPAILNVADDVHSKLEQGNAPLQRNPLTTEMIRDCLESVSREKGWNPFNSAEIPLRDSMELTFWGEMMKRDLKSVWTHIHYKKFAHCVKVLVVESSADIMCLGNRLRLSDVAASLTSVHRQAIFVRFEKGLDWETTLEQTHTTPIVVSMDENDVGRSQAFELCLQKLVEERPYSSKEFSDGQVQIIVQCKHMQSFLRKLSLHSPLLLRYAETCTLQQNVEHAGDLVRSVAEAIFDKTLLQICGSFDVTVDITPETKEAIIASVLGMYERSLQWHTRKQNEITKETPSHHTTNPLGHIFEHVYISAWLLANCWYSNKEARTVVTQQLSALSSLDSALETATLQYNEVQQEFEMTLDRTSSLLLSIAQQKHIIEKREFDHAAEEFSLKSRAKKLELGKKKAQLKIETSYQSFLKGVESVLQVSEMEIEDVRMNNKPPKLVQRLARACAYILALNHPNTKDQVAKTKAMDWSELNTNLFSRIRVYDNTVESRISFFKREIDTFPIDEILEKVRTQHVNVQEALDELNSLLLLPDFKLHRVEQVSKALKPLCAWILAVYEHIKESLELDHLEIEHNRCQTEMKMFQNLNALKEKDEVQRLKRQLLNLKKNYEICSENFTALEQRKRNLEYYIETCKLLIEKVRPWRSYCEAALDKLDQNKEVLSFEIVAAGSIVVYASSLDKKERDHLKKCWGEEAFAQILELCKVGEDNVVEAPTTALSFDLHDFLRRNFTHEWFLDEEVNIFKVLDICNQSTLHLGSQTHFAESIGIAWLAWKSLGKTCLFIDPEEICQMYVNAWEASQGKIKNKAKELVSFSCVKIEDVLNAQDSDSGDAKPGLRESSGEALVYAQSTLFPHESHSEEDRLFAKVHIIDLTLKEPNQVHQNICILMSRFFGKTLHPLVCPEKPQLAIQEMQDELQILLLNLSDNKTKLCKTFTDSAYKEFISQKDSDLTIDLGKLQLLKTGISAQLEDYESLSNHWKSQQDLIVNYFGTIPDSVKVFAKCLSTLFSASSVAWGYFHGCPLNLFINVLERKMYSALPVAIKESGEEVRKQFLSSHRFQKQIVRSMFDLLVTRRYMASDWILKTMHLAFHFEFLGESRPRQPGRGLQEEEWGYFLEHFLQQCLSAEGIDRRVDISLNTSGKGWNKKILKVIRAFQKHYSGGGSYDVVESIFGNIKELGMEIGMEDVLGNLDQCIDAMDSRADLTYWRFAVVLFMAASSHREEELVALWLIKQIIAMDFTSSTATQASDLAEQIELLDNRIPLLLASTTSSALQLVEQAALRYSMSFQKVSDGKMKTKNIWQVVAQKSMRSKKLHTQEVSFVSIYHLYSLEDEALDKFLFKHVEDGDWLVLVDVDIENKRHKRICKMFQEILAPQLFLSPPKSRFKLILCMNSYETFNPFIHSISTVVASKPNASKTLDISFFACKCLPYMCSRALWQGGEVVGIHDKASITSPSMLSGEVLELFEAYQSYAERCLHEAAKEITHEEDRLKLQQTTPTLLTEESELGAAWRGYAIIIALVQRLVVDRQMIGCGVPKGKRHMYPSHFEFIAGVQAIKNWLDVLMKAGESMEISTSTLALDRILGAERIKKISSGIIGSVYGPLYGCVLFSDNPEEKNKVIYNTEDFHMIFWSAMYSRYFTYDILKPSFMYKLATVGSMLTKPKEGDEYYTSQQTYPVRAMAKAGNSLVAIGDFVGTVLALPADSLSSISDLSSVAIGQVTFFKRNQDYSQELLSLQHLLLHRTVLPTLEMVHDLNAKMEGMIDQCKRLHAKVQGGHTFLRGIPHKSKLISSLSEFLRSELEAMLSLLFRVLTDLSKAVRFLGLLRNYEVDVPPSSSEMNLLLCIFMNYVPNKWKLSKHDSDTRQHNFSYSSLSSWRSHVEHNVEFIFSICDEVEQGKPKLTFDLRRVLNPRLFFDTLRVGFCMNNQTQYPSLKYDFVSEKVYASSPDITRGAAARDYPDIVIMGLSVSNAIWNENTQQLQDIRMQLDQSEAGKDHLPEHVQCSRLLPPFVISPSVGEGDKVDLPANILFHKSLLTEEYCDLPLVASCISEDLQNHTDHLICTLRLPSRRSTSYWLRKGTTAFLHRS